jgi:hypothetical protein
LTPAALSAATPAVKRLAPRKRRALQRIVAAIEAAYIAEMARA